jgi:hypothetical protein
MAGGKRDTGSSSTVTGFKGWKKVEGPADLKADANPLPKPDAVMPSDRVLRSNTFGTKEASDIRPDAAEDSSPIDLEVYESGPLRKIAGPGFKQG